jgi:serine phosphatase RsbU (regulator of sigma subunit)
VKSAALEDLGPREVCALVNQVIHGNIPLNKFISCSYGFNARTRQLVSTNAGHNPPLLIRRDGECTRLVEGGPLLGAFSE